MVGGGGVWLGGRWQEICRIYSLIFLGTSLSAELQTVAERRTCKLSAAVRSCLPPNQYRSSFYLYVCLSCLYPQPQPSDSPAGAKSMSPEAD